MEHSRIAVAGVQPDRNRLIIAGFFAVAPVVVGLFLVIDAPVFPMQLLPLMALSLVVAILVLNSGRRITADRQGRRFVDSISVFGMDLKRTDHPFDDFERSELRREMRTQRAGTEGTSTYHVEVAYLKGPSGRWKIRESTRSEDGRAIAERLSKASGLPMTDHTGDEPVERKADELDLSFRERRRRGGDNEAPAANRPDHSRFRVETRTDGVRVQLPPPPVFTINALVWMAIAAVIFFTVYITSPIGAHDASAAGRLAFFVVAGLVTAAPLLGKLMLRIRRPRLVVTREQVVHYRTPALPGRSMKAKEVEEILSRDSVIILVGDYKRMRLALNTGKEDVHYLKNLLIHYLG